MMPETRESILRNRLQVAVGVMHVTADDLERTINEKPRRARLEMRVLDVVAALRRAVESATRPVQ